MAKRYGDRWEVIESLPGGGQAAVFSVRDLTDDSTGWVLKRLKNVNRLGRFEQEIEALKRIESPRIPAVVDYSLDDPPYLVTKNVGEALSTALTELQPTFDERISWLVDACQAAVDASAEGIVHRDIKPDNIVVNYERRRAYLIDFGICQFDDEGAFETTTGEALGSRSFAAPELEAGSAVPPSEKSDVYSLAKVLYWVLSSRRNIAREDVAIEHLREIPDERGIERAHIGRLLALALHEEPTDRVGVAEFHRQVELVRTLIREGVNAVGVDGQRCPTCRIGALRIMPGDSELGYQQFSKLGRQLENFRVLHCGYCGYLQHHELQGTRAGELGLWEA